MRLLNRIANLIGWTVILLVLLAALFWWQGVPYAKERIKSVLRTRYALSPSADIEVELLDPQAVIEGRIASLTIRSPEALVGSIPVVEFELSAYGLSFDPLSTLVLGDPKLGEIERGEVSFAVREDSLEKVWRDRARRLSISDLAMRIGPERVKVFAKVDLLLIKVPASVYGTFVAEGSRVRFREASRELGEDKGAEAGKLIDRLVGRLAPAIDLSELGKGFMVDEARLEQGRITVRGSAG